MPRYRLTLNLARPRFFAGPILLMGVALGQSGGLYLPENGGPINGTAQAGSAALARDAETAWLNPAGMTRLDSTEVMLSLMPFNLGFTFDPSSDTTASGSDGGDQGGWFPGGAFFLAAPVSDSVAVGFSATSPGGLALDPSDDWAGRTWVSEVAMVSLNFEPSVGVRLSDQWSIGGGLDIQYMTFKQDLLRPGPLDEVGIDGDSWGVGFSLSALWEPSETTRFGLRYRSEISHDLSGDLTVTGSTPVSTSFTMPMSLTFSPYHKVSETVALMADIGWTDWSAFDRNVITVDGSGVTAELPRNFKDTWLFGLGTHWEAAEDWLLMFGASYVSSAVDDQYRTPDLPVDEQFRLAAGCEYQLGGAWTLGANYTFAWLGDNEIDQTKPLPGRIAGDYDAYAHLFGLYASVSF